MSADEDRPWLGRYRDGAPLELEREDASPLGAFRRLVQQRPDGDLMRFRGRVVSVAEADVASDALAAVLAGEHDVVRGDRVALFLQNDPAYVLSLLAVWKLGAVAVACSPMLKAAELEFQLRDAGARVLIALDELETVAREAAGAQGITLLIAGPDEVREVPPGRERPPGHSPGADEVAVLTYTSGTTGPPKGAMNTHGNIAFSSQVYRDWCGLGPDDVILGIAPLFHVTGLVAHIGVALLTGAPLLLDHRFEPEQTARLVEEHRATFTVAAITVFIALINHSAARAHDLSSLSRCYSGGAPIAPAIVEAYEQLSGVYIHNVYGLTETTSPSHMVPLGTRAPVDPRTGALSIGVPVFETCARVLDEEGVPLGAGEVGELAIRGPQVVPGYWNRPQETELALPGGELRTGDVGLMDAQGWFYVVDRRKDLIIASGYKVWPRDVEDALYRHPAVREAAVVGVPDSYRGETVKAYVSLRPGADAGPAELVEFAREHLAAYKYPRQVEILDELPKTPSGKILRRELRARG